MASLDLLLTEETIVLPARAAKGEASLSAWSQSGAKRCFDVACVLCSLPFLLPLLLAIGLAVRITSRGPVLFRQQRIGCNNRPFTILKFRTMPVVHRACGRPAVTTASNQRFTPIGAFLRHWKLDELPQLINVLKGDMSLVGPRPKLPSHQVAPLICKPGITGLATHTFVREESMLAGIPSEDLEDFYREIILPLKQKLDDSYMSTATLKSDLLLIFRSALRQ